MALSRIVRLFFAILLVFGLTKTTWADEPTVTAVLTSSETEVDRPVQLQIKVTGDTNANPPSDIAVDGLDIRYTGQSQLMEGRNFRFTYSSFTTTPFFPLKAGTFTIPPQSVRTSGGTLRTPALTLNVAANDDGTTTSRRGGNRGAGGNAIDEKKIVFAELIIPKTTAYVGETIPAEIRLGISTRVPHRLIEGATLSGQGFTAQRMPNPAQTMESVNGRSYEVVTFKTAITAVRSWQTRDRGQGRQGDHPGSTSQQWRLVPRSPFDIFGMDDPFSDPFFNDPFAGIGEQREIKFSSETTTLDIKPLPPNAPPSFAGAVGIFSLTADVKPKTAQIGDPLTVTASISGRGNFDRVAAPVLENDRGWHTYPPGSNFKAGRRHRHQREQDLRNGVHA